MASVELDNAVLRERIDVQPSLAIFRVAPEAGTVPAFEPGQFTNLGLRPAPGARLVKRALSLASGAEVRDHREFYVRRVEDGEFTPELFRLAPGARLWLDARVYGSFTLAEIPPGHDLLMVATGTGLAPFVSMLRTYGGRGRWRRCVLLESARTAAELGYRAELERCAREDPSIAYRPTLTREPAASGWSGLTGRVQTFLEPAAFERLTGAALDPARWRVLLCGSPEMIDSVRAQLAPLGFRPHRRRAPGEIHAERFW